MKSAMYQSYTDSSPKSYKGDALLPNNSNI